MHAAPTLSIARLAIQLHAGTADHTAILREILQVDLFSAIVAATWHEQNPAQDRLQVEITPMILLRQSEVIPMLRFTAKRYRGARCGRKYELMPRQRQCLRF